MAAFYSDYHMGFDRGLWLFRRVVLVFFLTFLYALFEFFKSSHDFVSFELMLS